MSTLLIAVGVFVAYIIAYNTYGRWLAKKIFQIDPEAVVPSVELQDDIDYVPTRREVIFGHHFTSIAGTGPIVGPAIAVFWGWLPALIWVIFGSIFLGAVHDFAALVVSLRNRGLSVGEVAGRIVSPRARLLFLLILFFALTLVIAVFGLVIASIFRIYPESVLAVWISLPIAVLLGLWVHNRHGGLLIPSLMALGIVYLCIYIGAYWMPITLPAAWGDPVIVWTVLLLIYCFIASVLPVWLLLQPRDFVNSHQLVVALVILLAGLAVASFTGQADIVESAPAVVTSEQLPKGAPPLMPFLFITVACGAISGFHSLVSSGTTSKQVAKETDALSVGYGSMLLEGALAVMVIAACCAGVGMGNYERIPTETTSGYDYQELQVNGEHLTGRAAWESRYDTEKGWNAFGLGQKVGAFVEGGANFVTSLGIPLKMSMGIMAVLVACFAATTLDTATRLQRYVIQELSGTLHVRPFKNKYLATILAVGLAGTVALLPGPSGKMGTGGLILWPLFGAINQLLAGLTFLVVMFYLWRRNRPIWFIAFPAALLVVMPAWAMLWQMFHAEHGWLFNERYLLFCVGGIVLALQIWMVIEGLLVWRKAKGVLEDPLPPLEKQNES